VIGAADSLIPALDALGAFLFRDGRAEHAVHRPVAGDVLGGLPVAYGEAGQIGRAQRRRFHTAGALDFEVANVGHGLHEVVVGRRAAVHPESYDAAKALLELTGHTLADVKNGAISDLPARLGAYGEEKAAEEIGVGVPTLRDIVSELLKPGRDVRDELPKPILRTDVLEMKDLDAAMLAALRQTNGFVLSEGKPLDPESKAAYEDILAHSGQNEG